MPLTPIWVAECRCGHRVCEQGDGHEVLDLITDHCLEAHPGEECYPVAMYRSGFSDTRTHPLDGYDLERSHVPPG